MISFVSTFLTFVAFIFLLFAILGDINNVPGINNIYYYRLDFSKSGLLGGIENVAGTPDFLTMGLWTYCYGTYDAGIQYCSPPKLGYEIDDTGPISAVISEEGGKIDSAMSQVVAGLFIPSIVFTFLALLLGVFSHKGRWPMFIASCLASIAFLFTAITIIFIFVSFAVVAHEVANITSSINTSMGNAAWLTLAAGIALLLASGGFLFSCCCGRKKRVNDTEASEK